MTFICFWIKAIAAAHCVGVAVQVDGTTLLPVASEKFVFLT
jgi:hypothetical protein